LEERAAPLQPLGGQWGLAAGVRCPQRGRAEKRGDDEALGRSRGGLSTKRHATVDARGTPTGVLLTGGQAADLVGAEALVPPVVAPTLIADKGYDAEARVVAPRRAGGKTAVLPPKRTRAEQRAYDRHRYCARHLIEHFCCNLKQ
jgi:transposase